MMINEEDMWIPHVKGDPNGEYWEISVVRKSNIHGIKSCGWFDEDKLLISHNGGACHWPLAPGLGPLMVEVAHRYADYLNQGGKKLEFNKLLEFKTTE